MSHADQHDPEEGAPERVSERALRAIQAFDFESGQAIFNGSHALAEFLAVLPGPCGLYRLDYISRECLANYFQIVSSPTNVSFVEGNLKIAEDRILSYGAVLWASRPGSGKDGTIRIFDCVTHYVPDATFYFEAETDLGELVRQRRRWLNGTTAGYIWLFSVLWRRSCTCNRRGGSEADRDDHSFKFQLTTIFNLISQMAVFGVIFILPGYFFASFLLSLRGR